jgi:hypothetical protein
MESLHNVAAVRQIAREREDSLRRSVVATDRSTRQLRRWIGHQLVRTGTWLASDRPMQPAGAR